MADDELRRRERQARVAPGDPEAQARLAAARSRTGETPLVGRALEALERAARAQEDLGARTAALGEVAWGQSRAGQPVRAEALCRAAIAEAERAGAAGLPGLARAGATLARAGRRAEGVALLARAAAAPGVEDPGFAWLRCCGDAALRSGELRTAFPGVEALVRRQANRWAELADLAPQLGPWELLGPVTAGLEDALEREGLYGRNQAAGRLAALGALTPVLARGFVERLLSDPPGDPFDDPVDSLSISAVGTALRIAELDPVTALEPCIARLQAAGRPAAALTLRLALLRARARSPTPPTEADYRRALEDAAQLGHGASSSLTRNRRAMDAERRPLLVMRGLCDGLATVGAAEPLPVRTRARLLRLGLGLAPDLILARSEVLGALAAAASRLGPEGHALVREATVAALQVLTSPASWNEPRWLAFEPLELCAEAAPALEDGLSLLSGIAAAASASRALDRPRANLATLRFFSARALLACACSAHALGAETQAADWRAQALDQLGAQTGHDLAHGLQYAAQTLAGQHDPVWRAESVLGLAEACARGPAPDPRPGGAFALLVALLDPP